MLKINDFLFQKIAAKFDYHKLKKYVDFGFVIVEKAIVNLDKLHLIYFDIYDEMIENEITLAGISKGKSVLHIGCGPIPATPILIAKKSDVQVTGIDNDSNSVKKARLYVLKNGFSDKIQIIHADAINFHIEDFNIIIISQGVKPIKDILDHISKSMKNDTSVIFRTSTSSDGEISQNDLFIKDLFKIDKTVFQKKNALLISIMLKKKN